MVKIMLDSSSDSRNTHPCDYYIPLTVDIGGRAYKDGVDLRAQKFYRLLTTTAEFPKTSQPSPEDFMEAFSEVGMLLGLCDISQDTVACPPGTASRIH